jgi:hypothetical protein
MNAKETGAGGSGAIQSAYEKWENFYGLIVGLSGFACIGLIFMSSAYFVVFVVIAAAAGLARYVVRKKIRDLATTEPSDNPWRKMSKNIKYPEKPGPQSPFHDLLRKLGH